MRKAKVVNERLLFSYDSDWICLPFHLSTDYSLSSTTQGNIVWKLKMGDFFLES